MTNFKTVLECSSVFDTLNAGKTNSGKLAREKRLYTLQKSTKNSSVTINSFLVLNYPQERLK